MNRNSTMPGKKITIAIIVCSMLMVVVAALIFGKSNHSFGKSNVPANASVSKPSPAVTDNTRITSGAYTGWTRYHNKDLGFSINVPPAVEVKDYAKASQSDPSYASFLMDIYSDSSDRTIEFLHLAVYQADLQTSAMRQDTAQSDIYQIAPVKKDLIVAGHKAVLYFYDSDIRAVMYLIDDGPRTFAINGFIHTKDPESVASYWEGFGNTLESFAIDEQMSQ